MDLFEAFNQAGLLAKMSLLIGFAPLFPAVAYLIRPTERTLAFMRPVSLTATFGGLSGLGAGLIAVLRGMALIPEPSASQVYLGLSEAAVPAFFNFGLLAIAWLLVTAGMLRREIIED